jgi:WD40 repeat protein
LWEEDSDKELSDLMFTSDGSSLVHREYGWWAKKKRFTSWLVFRDPATGEVARTKEVADTEAWARSALSPDGQWLVTLRITRAEFAVRQLIGRATAVRWVGRESPKDLTDLAFHPSGRVLAVTSNDGTVALYDTATWKVGCRFAWEAGKLRCVAFSPDGSLAAAGSDAGQVVVWDVDL